MLLFALALSLELASVDPTVWTIHVTNDTCPDYTWGLTEEETRRAFADLVRVHLDEMARTDGEPFENRDRYTMAVTQEALCFIERHPDRTEELIGRIREGRICVSPFLANSLWGFQSDEGAIRTLYPARRLEREWGIPIDVAEHIELPSLPWGMATILSGCGIRWVSIPFLAYDSTFGGLRNPPLYILEGPDGGAIRVAMDPWASNKSSYMQGAHLLREPHAIVGEWIPHYAALGDAYPIRAILASGTHGDISPASGRQARGFADAIIRHNASPGPRPRLVNSTPRIFCDEVDRAEAARPFLRRLRGCFGHSWELWPVSLAKYAARLREGEREFLSAEALIATAAGRDPRAGEATRADRERAEWCWAMLADHAWNGSNDENRRTNAELRRRWSDELNAIAAELRRAGWLSAGLREEAGRWTVFNPLSIPRRDRVRIEDPDGARIRGAQVIEEDGVPVAYVLSPELPGFAFAPLEADADAGAPPLRASATELDGPFYRLRIDPETGAIASLVHKASGAELLAAPTGPALAGVRTRVAAEGPVLARLAIEGTAGDANVASHVTIYARIDRVDLDIRIRKPASPKPTRLCHTFPVLRARSVLRIDATGAVIRPKPQPEGDLLPGADPRRFAVQGFVDASPPEGPGVTIAPLDAFCLRLDLDPLTFEALGNDQNEREVTRDQHGATDFRFRYALRGHAGPYDGAEAFAWSRSAASPPLAARGALDGSLSAPPISIDPRRAIATAWKPADDGAAGGWILRIRETSGRSGPLAIAVPGFKKAIRTDLLERDADPIPIADGRATIDLSAHGLAAVRLVR